LTCVKIDFGIAFNENEGRAENASAAVSYPPGPHMLRCNLKIPENTAGQQTSVKAVLVNFSAMNADLLKVAFDAQETVAVLGNAANASELAALLREQPQVALIASSGDRKESNALAFLDQIVRSGRPVRSIVMSEDMGREDFVTFFYRGARGLVCKSKTDVALLLKCICCVSAGQVWANSGQLEQLLCSLSQPVTTRVTNSAGDALLSQREEQVLHLLARGLSNRDLARVLKLSEHTVKNHLFRIFDKLGVSNRMEAVLYAVSKNSQRSLTGEVENKADSKRELGLGSGAA
jgi:DNA-binding NarL/FixJ family response regulator